MLKSIPERLSRITSSGKFIREIDGLRFMAIFPVLVQHLNERFVRNTPLKFSQDPYQTTVGFFASMGFLGVFIFFVISGFVLALPFASYKLQQGKAINLKSYYWRRVTRLEPPYIIWMSIFFLVFLLAKHESFWQYLPHYLANITYTHSLIYHDWSPFNPPTWTLEIEIQFYILAPFLALSLFGIANKTTRRVAMVAVIAVVVLLQQVFIVYFPTLMNSNHTMPFYFTILGHLQYFLLGFILVDLYLTNWKEIDKKIGYDILAVLSLLATIYSWSWDFELLNRIIVLVALFVFFYSAFKSIYFNRFITNRWIMAIGGMCYTIYLIHLPFSEFLIKLTKKITAPGGYEVNLLLQLAIYIPLILILSAIGFLLLEKPCMDKYWPQKLSAFLSGKKYNGDDRK